MYLRFFTSRSQIQIKQSKQHRPIVPVFWSELSGFIRILNFNRVTDSQLAALSQACQPASFGVSQKDVLGESYRRAGKMEPSAFSTQFSPSSLGIVELVRATLLQGQSAKSIRVELYKLDVYGTHSSHFNLVSSLISLRKVLVLFSRPMSILHEARPCLDRL